MSYVVFTVTFIVVLFALRWVVINWYWPTYVEPKHLLPADVAIRTRNRLTAIVFAVAFAAALLTAMLTW